MNSFLEMEYRLFLHEQNMHAKFENVGISTYVGCVAFLFASHVVFFRRLRDVEPDYDGAPAAEVMRGARGPGLW